MSRSTLVLAALSLLALVSSVQATLQIPSSWGTCKRSDPKFDDCLKGAMQRALTDLQDGNADFGVKSMDPFKVKQLRLDKGAGGALSIDMTFSDVELVGLKNAKIESVKSDLNKYKFSALIRTQHLDMNAKYKVIGKVLLIPINGAGRSIIKMNNPLMKLSMQGHLRKGKSGKEFLEFTTVSFEIVPEKSDFQFINPAHATQASLLSRVVSENDKVIMQDLQPAVSESFSLAFGEIANSIFEKVAFQDAFPE